MKNIIITESQFRFLMEGINYSKSGDFNMDVNIDSDQTDAGNIGFDTRLFGTANNILRGDGTRDGRTSSFETLQASRNAYINFLTQLRQWVLSGKNGNPPDFSKISGRAKSAIESALARDDDELLQWIDTTIERVNSLRQMHQNKYNQATKLQGNETLARYNVGAVPGTGIKVISLFDFDDFNVSDVLKNGYMRQGEITDKAFGFTKDTRPLIPGIGRGKATQKNVPVTYNGQTPDIQRNFSLNGLENDTDHFNRVQYGLSDSSYHSVAKFIDKSVNYANYALKKENIQADYIVCAPSSSQFNVYYSKRLQDKTGIPFINGFFTKRLINVHFDREGMEKEGIAEETINSYELSIKQAAMKEISMGMSAPLRNFVNSHWDLFKNVGFDIQRPTFRGRKPATPRPEEVKYNRVSGATLQTGQVYQIIAEGTFEQISQMILSPVENFGDNTTRMLLNNLKVSSKSSVFDIENLSQKIGNIITKNCLSDFKDAIRKTAWTIASYHDKLLAGFKPNFDSASFKVTKFPKNVRKYLEGAYIISDEQLNKDNNLFSRYAGKNYIIFDEDMNSGATLAMLGDALGDYGIPQQNITCLVNGYSSGGF